MAEINGWVILVALIAAYALAIFLLHQRRRLGPDRALSLYGPALMIKTRKGRGFLERVGRFERLWSVVGDLGIVLAGIAMVVIVALLSVEAVAIRSVPASAAPSPQTALGLPGINPIIPIGYGIVALVIGVVLHELFHGVMARSQKIGVKSLGILWLVVPIGAFVEQDDAEMAKAPRRARARVVAAGVLANFALCVVFFLASSAILSTSVAPNANGAGVATVVSGFPAANASIHPGDILVSVNGNATTNNSALYDALHATHAGQTVPVVFYSHDQGRIVTEQVTLAPLSMYTGIANDSARGFLGVGVTILTPTQLDGIIATPWTAPGPPGAGIAAWVILPLWQLQPVQGTATLYYHSTGVLSGVDVGGIWIGVNLLYWLAWMNLLLGLSNALPIFPFDGGLLFREFYGTILGRFRRGWEAARRDRAASQAAAVASLFVVFLIVWLFVGPRL